MKVIETGFMKRKRKITGSKFIQTLVFGWLDNPDATLEELTQTGVKVGLDISPQGLDKRFTKESSEFLYKVLEPVFNTYENPIRVLRVLYKLQDLVNPISQ